MSSSRTKPWGGDKKDDGMSDVVDKAAKMISDNVTTECLKMILKALTLAQATALEGSIIDSQLSDEDFAQKMTDLVTESSKLKDRAIGIFTEINDSMEEEDTKHVTKYVSELYYRSCQKIMEILNENGQFND